MLARRDKVFSEKTVIQKTKILAQCLEGEIDAYIKLHPDMRKGEGKQSRNLTNLINIHAQIRDTMNRPMRDICAIEKYTLLI